MSKINDGGPAFPMANATAPIQAGITRRQYYAAAAAQGWIAKDRIQNPYTPGDLAFVAHTAFAIADAMIAHEQGGR
jgi:hypothetical protein